MHSIPRLMTPDRTLSMLRNPYGFVSERARTLGTDVFETRLLLRKTICMTGPEAARLFYDPARFQRSGAAPGRVRKTLFGQGGVQGLDEDAHRHRKQAFIEIVEPGRVEDLAQIVTRHWSSSAERWTAMDQVQLYPQVQELLTRAVCEWAAVPLGEDEVGKRTRHISALFDAAGGVGPRHWRSRMARKSADRWAEDIIDAVRAGELSPPQCAAAHIIAWHTDLDGQVLPSRTAAVDLLNVIRPTVAVAVYITFIAHALDQHPRWRQRLATGDGSEDELFVEEVRRYYPFFPAVMAIVRDDFDWHGHHFPKGHRALLDPHGTNHDPRTWQHPDRFDPERFTHWDRDPYTFIPQGGGDPQVHHRCPGEPITTRLMRVAVDMLTRHLDYVVARPHQPIDDTRLPALPRDRMVIRHVST